MLPHGVMYHPIRKDASRHIFLGILHPGPSSLNGSFSFLYSILRCHIDLRCPVVIFLRFWKIQCVPSIGKSISCLSFLHLIFCHRDTYPTCIPNRVPHQRNMIHISLNINILQGRGHSFRYLKDL